jgi:HlyD family secretion protein
MRRTPIAILIIVLILLIGLGYFMTNPEAWRSVLVELGLAEPVQEGYVVTGMLETQITYLSSVNGGKVLELHVEEGQQVEDGDTLVTLDPSLIEPLLDAAKARYDASKVKLDMLLADPRSVDLAAAQAALDLAIKIKESADQALEDAREFASEQLRDDQIALAQAEVEQAQAGIDLAQANLTALEEGVSEKEISAAEASVDAAEADVAGQKAKLDAQVILAPFEGVVLETFMLPGERSIPGQRIISLTNLDTLEVSVYIPEADLGWAKIGDEVELNVDAYPDRVFHGEVIYIADQAEFTPRNVQTPEERTILVYQVRIRVPNSGDALKPGLPAEVTFGVES